MTTSHVSWYFSTFIHHRADIRDGPRQPVICFYQQLRSVEDNIVVKQGSVTLRYKLYSCVITNIKRVKFQRELLTNLMPV
jgi:hypothetical protein